MNPSPSTAETKPICRHFPKCGGCRFQTTDAEGYAAWKMGMLSQLLSRSGMGVVKVNPLLVVPLRTRRRVKVAAKGCGRGKVAVGLRGYRSHEIVRMEECPVLLPELEKAVTDLSANLAGYLSGGGECEIQITALPTGLDAVIIGGDKLGLRQREELAALASNVGLAQLSWRKWSRSEIEPVAFARSLSLVYGDNVAVRFPAGSFLQAAQSGEAALIDFAKRCAGDSKSVLDLFCGLGGFGLSFGRADKVVFSDIDGAAIEALEETARRIPNRKVERRNLSSSPFNSDECGRFEAIIVDPPRGGALAQAKNIAASKAKDVIMVSCDPPSFIRDAKTLLAGGYSLMEIQPVDQFLFSPHLEIAAHFRRIK